MKNLSRAAIFSLSLLIIAFQAISASDIEEIDINSAPIEDLVKIIHIGEKRAEELISLRPFSSLDDLTRIKGLGEKRVEDIKKQGLAWVGVQEESEPEPEPLPELKPIIYPSGILINEVLPSPEGPDEKEEWAEIFNQNNFEVNLSNWQVTDTEGKANTYTFPEGTKISARGFLVLSRPTTKITLNNDGDGLNLLQPDGKIIDGVAYEKAPRGESYNKTESGWVWSPILTPGSVNIIPSPPSAQLESKEKPKSEVEPPKIEEPQAEKGLAAIGEQVPDSSKSLFVLLIALILAIFSGIIILILKRKTKTGYNKNV